MCICVELITTTIRYVYMCCLSIITTTIRYVYMCCLVEHYNNNNKACVYVLPCGAL